ncbi:hypothetical protein BRADI_3g26040v3 [Brachypodium distachyon]|uniref:Uncharacterized protein n=1 Tax=Brachypodium distachyon TaxID=15368 RepID=A0A2K2CZA2_BRADI|nr:hypothetical protein BRADI_3g26040v3 [Brachypodium distachyon]
MIQSDTHSYSSSSSCRVGGHYRWRDMYNFPLYIYHQPNSEICTIFHRSPPSNFCRDQTLKRPKRISPGVSTTKKDSWCYKIQRLLLAAGVTLKHIRCGFIYGSSSHKYTHALCRNCSVSSFTANYLSIYMNVYPIT